MASPRHARVLLAAAFALLPLGAGSGAKNQATAPGVDSEILVKNAGPLGTAPASLNQPWAWAVNSIDSVLFVDDIDTTRLEVTSFRMVDPLGRTIPGTVRFVASNMNIFYTQAFPSPAYDFIIKDPPARSTLGKVYFIPDQPLSGHTTYSYLLSTGIRMQKGQLRRDGFRFAFTTGDSIAPPAPGPLASR